MGKKLKLLPWQWPLCGHSKSSSFRAGDEFFTAVNSVFFDHTLSDRVETPESWFTNSSLSESASFSTESGDEFEANAMEMVVRGAKSERLIFEPGETNSILHQKSTEEQDYASNRFEESVVLVMESEDPYLDFRRSMEEMVESCGIEDWARLEELLNWYLSVNRTKNHGYILCAFVDLLIDNGDSADSL